ncbi:Uncharacterised protein [Actinomyces bovis]|uniref:Tat pathway signal sequence domain protein n=1 Tax=Actinomyces bovis TaxID=1658 RepID=A0ABY1VLV8_9ACTO|nr:hypothetical protein [Actinomyces bovis]SPT52656.1 Uncharacterised protein [Actinomyces bovis]VEG54556.1 Uncharacterised protein [Actinomyces israelii]
MDRRMFITAAAAVAAAGLTSCSGATQAASVSPTNSASPILETTVPAPKPPSSSAVPSSFGSNPLWQGAEILAVHDQYLVGSAWSSQAVGVAAQGLCPVIVDLATGVSTAILPGGPQGFTTSRVSLDASQYTSAMSSYRPPAGNTVPRLHAAAALLGSEHAYLVVGVEMVLAEVGRGRGAQERECPVSLLRVRLADGRLESVARLSSSFSVQLLSAATTPPLDFALSFSPDRGSLLVAGSGFGSADFIAMRLRAEDLAVELDVHELLEQPSSYTVTSLGQAVVARALRGGGDLAFMLGTGASQANTSSLVLVRDGWCYYGDGKQVLATNLETDQTVSLQADPTHAGFLGSAWPRITSDSRDLVLHCSDLVEVLRPGQPAPLLRLDGNGRQVPYATAAFGDVAYTMPQSANNRPTSLEMLSLGSGESLGSLRSTAGWLNGLAVTSWGLACDAGTFYPAQSWF